MNIDRMVVVNTSMNDGDTTNTIDNNWTVTFRSVGDEQWTYPQPISSESDAMSKIIDRPMSRGDLARMIGPDSRERLFVMDGSMPREVTREGVSFASWEGDGASASAMMKACDGVGLRTLVSVACDIAESSLHYMSKGTELARETIDVARRSVSGAASAEEVKSVGNKCYEFAQFASMFGGFGRDIGLDEKVVEQPRASAAGAFAAVCAAKASLSDSVMESAEFAAKFAIEAAKIGGGGDAANASMASIVRRHIPLHAISLVSVAACE